MKERASESRINGSDALFVGDKYVQWRERASVLIPRAGKNAGAEAFLYKQAPVALGNDRHIKI
jgi:hypothetical protein